MMFGNNRLRGTEKLRAKEKDVTMKKIMVAIITLTLGAHLNSAPAKRAPALRSATAIDPAMKDAKCFLALSSMTDGKPEAETAQITPAIMFFFGKLVGRNPGFSLKGFVEANSAALNALDPKVEAPRCMAELEKSAKSL
jgi:hypothetical protein